MHSHVSLKHRDRDVITQIGIDVVKKDRERFEAQSFIGVFQRNRTSCIN